MTFKERYTIAREWLKAASLRIDTIGVRLYAAAIAYRTIFSLVAFTSTIILVAVVLGLNAAEAAQAGGDIAGVPEDIEAIARDRIARTLELGISSVVIAGIAGFLLGLYGMAGGFAAICDVLDRVHGTQRYVRLTMRYLRGAGIAAVFVVLAGIAIVLVALSSATGTYVLDQIGLDEITGVWSFLVTVFIPTIAFIAAYMFVLRYGSHARPPWSEVICGALVASVCSIILLFGFAAAVRVFDAWQTYGVFASAVVLLLFGYLQAYVLIYVAMFGREVVYVATLAPLTRRIFHNDEEERISHD